MAIFCATFSHAWRLSTSFRNYRDVFFAALQHLQVIGIRDGIYEIDC